MGDNTTSIVSDWGLLIDERDAEPLSVDETNGDNKDSGTLIDRWTTPNGCG